MVNMLVLSFLLLSASAFASVTRVDKPYYSLEDADKHFEDFIQTYNKHYASEAERNIRFEIFKKKLHEINQMNADPKQKHAIFGVNQFSDLTIEEFKNKYMGCTYDTNKDMDSENFIDVDFEPMDQPDKFDWRERNAVTPVKDQGGCGSCWAFSIVGSVEGAYAIKYKKILPFSEQQLVDCDREKNHGCDGGDLEEAMKYLKKTGGLQGEDDYPYEGKEDTCKFNVTKVKAKLVTYYRIKLDQDNDYKTRNLLMRFGPLSIALDATAFLNYNKGVLDCYGSEINHGVLLVGYGTENGEKYWLIKNSWGTLFGEDGYIRLKATKNPCEMKTYGGLFPTLE